MPDHDLALPDEMDMSAVASIADLLIHSEDLSWLDRIECADEDPSAFFVDAGHTIEPRVLELCRRCPERVRCLTRAYERDLTNGYFGGLSPKQRRDMTLDEALEFIESDPPTALPLR